MAKSNGADTPIIIKKYANRRLYDTSTSSYVTLDHLSDLVRKGVDFEVRDAKTGEDLTRAVLTQIIFEHETKGEGALPLNFLRQLIGFYGGGAQTMLPAWLDMSMNSFADAQKRWAKTATNPMAVFEKQARRNMEAFEKTMAMFMPGGSAAPRESAQTSEDASDPTDDMLAAMQDQMAAMQAQLEELAKKS